jgi:hypothetical protein
MQSKKKEHLQPSCPPVQTFASVVGNSINAITVVATGPDAFVNIGLTISVFKTFRTLTLVDLTRVLT